MPDPPGGPLISVVMPNLDGERHLEKAIRSFLDQEHAARQLVIVDGRSRDGSHRIIERCAAAHPEIVWLREPDSGLSDAINRGIARATGEVIGYMGSDDLLYPGLFSCIARNLRLVDFDAIYFDSYTWYLQDSRIVLRRCPDLDFTRRNLLEYGTLVGLQNIYFRRRVFDVHRFDAGNRYSMDYEFYLRISGEGYLYLRADAVASINIFDGNITGRLGDTRQADEAAAVARRYATGGERLFFQRRRSPLRRLARLGRTLLGRSRG